MGIWSTSCSQPAFPSHHEKPWCCKPSGMVCHQAPVGPKAHKQGPWTGPKTGAEKCAEQGQMELIMQKRAPPAATSQSNQAKPCPRQFPGPSPKSQPMMRFILCSPVLTKDKSRPTQSGQMDSSIFSEQQSNFLPILKSPQFPNRPLWGSCRN